MIPKKPTIDVPNDNAEESMWDNGYIVGYSKKGNKVLWAFGFTPNSLQAKAFGVSLRDNKQIAVIADTNGNVLKQQKGFKHITKGFVLPKKPKVRVTGDNSARVMWHNGYIKGFSHNLVVWSFGFKQGSDDALAYKIFMPDAPRLVLTKPSGHTVKNTTPEEIQSVLDCQMD